MDITTEAVRIGLDMAQLRAQIDSSNIANANVPGARMQRADFGEVLSALRSAAEQPGADAAPLAGITPASLRADVHWADGTASPVSLDDEVAELNVASVTYRALAEGLTRRFALMQLAISGK